MKIIIKTLSILTVVALLATGCSKKDENTGASNIDYNPATVTLSSLSPNVFDESAIDTDNPATYQITIKATLDAPQPIDAVIDLAQVAGSANASDFDISGVIRIIAGQTSGIATVDILKTGDIEGDETLSIGATSKSNFNVIPFSHSVTIMNDHINSVLDLTLAWEGTSTIGDVTITSFCEMDFDLIAYDNNFDYVGYILGSADCPEEGSLSGFADGTYYLVADLYANPYEGSNFTDNIPLSLSWSQDYFPETSGIITDDSNAINRIDSLNASGDYTGDGLGALIIQLEVSGGYNYTITPM